MNTLEREICSRVRELRKKLRLTQSQFAALVDLSADCVGKIEREVSVPSLLTVFKITTALNIPVESLIIYKTAEQGESNLALKNLMSYLQTKSAEDINLIHDIAIKIFERKRSRRKQ